MVVNNEEEQTMTKTKPPQEKAVIILLKNGEIHEGHYLKNANYRVTNINSWRIYENNKKGRVVPDSEVDTWVDKEQVKEWLFRKTV